MSTTKDQPSLLGCFSLSVIMIITVTDDNLLYLKPNLQVMLGRGIMVGQGGGVGI